jgi:hypothetical protein
MAQGNQQGGPFTANTQQNPKEHCKAIATRSGKVINEGLGDDINVERKVVEPVEEEDEVVEVEKGIELEKPQEVVKEDEMEQNNKDVVKERGKKKEVEKKVAAQHLPYPHAPSKKDKER